MASVNHRGRSRSPLRVEAVGNRRDFKPQDVKTNDLSIMNQMMINNMYQPGNMMMAGGIYPNIMMPGAMMSGGIIPPNGMDMIPASGMELVPQATPMDMPVIAGGPPMAPGNPATGMDMAMMGGMMMDPAMMAMYDMTAIQPKKEIILKHCKLTPPDTGAPQQPRRARPPGCRTIFVGGLPDKIRESHIREIFELYGRIQTLRLAKKNYCHIRFDRESCVDAAMAISGYRLKLIKSKDKDKDSDDMDEDDDNSHATSGWLHVDYALSRDDQNEFERRQRHALRAQQAQMQQLNAQQDLSGRSSATRHRDNREPSPPRIQPFSNVTVVQLAEKLKSEEHFAATIPTLIAWLERGECSKKNSNQFYSMIQATNSHIRRLFNEKMQAEDELQECRERVKNHIERIIEQFEQVAKVFIAATHQRVWDHFTKPQRKNIETWQKMAAEFNTLKEEFNEKFENEDTDYISTKNMDISDDVQDLKRENESLQFQLEAYKNEIDVIKADALKDMEKFKAQFIARQALQEAMDKKPPLPASLVKLPPPPPPPSTQMPEDLDGKVHLKDVIEAGCGEAKLIGVISAFLQVHPQGASLDYVVSYVRALFPHVSQATVHHVLQKHTEVFRLTTTGVGANIENRWSFVAFEITS